MPKDCMQVAPWARGKSLVSISYALVTVVRVAGTSMFSHDAYVCPEPLGIRPNKVQHGQIGTFASPEAQIRR
jgi:hypothetical protein